MCAICHTYIARIFFQSGVVLAQHKAAGYIHSAATKNWGWARVEHGGVVSGESWNPLAQCEVKEVKDRDEARSEDGAGMKGGLEKRPHKAKKTAGGVTLRGSGQEAAPTSGILRGRQDAE